jgi:hypothetical protein
MEDSEYVFIGPVEGEVEFKFDNGGLLEGLKPVTVKGYVAGSALVSFISELTRKGRKEKLLQEIDQKLEHPYIYALHSNHVHVGSGAELATDQSWMSVKTEEDTPPTSVYRWTNWTREDMYETADILDRAADLLISDGWIAGTYSRTDGKGKVQHCTLGALRAVTEESYTLLSVHSSRAVAALVHLIRDEHEVIRQNAITERNIPFWNDRIARSSSEVVDLIQRAAKGLRERAGQSNDAA